MKFSQIGNYNLELIAYLGNLQISHLARILHNIYHEEGLQPPLAEVFFLHILYLEGIISFPMECLGTISINNIFLNEIK